MPIPLYLAMTASEMRCGAPLPEKIAWMACHFSSSGQGLTNLPHQLPPGSLLILDDSSPICGHDARRVCDELGPVIENCSGLLLDFERPAAEESMEMVTAVTALPFPVFVAAEYAKDLGCPVFLPPVPLLQTAEEYLAPWQGRQILLEAALSSEDHIITPAGFGGAIAYDGVPGPHFDHDLCCHYGIVVENDRVHFQLKRTREDLELLMNQAGQWGVHSAIGLFQELG